MRRLSSSLRKNHEEAPPEPTTVESLRQLQNATNPDTSKTLKLLLTADSPLDLLTSEIETSVLGFLAREIRISVPEGSPSPDWDSGAAQNLFRVLGELRKVRSITLVGLGDPRQSFPVARLVQLLSGDSRTKRLKTLELVRMRMETVEEEDPLDLLQLQQILEWLRRIRRLTWQEYVPEPNDPRCTVVGHPWILKAILSLPRLDTLSLQGWGDHSGSGRYLGTVDGMTLHQCCDSYRLEELTIQNFQFTQYALELAAKRIRYNGVIRVLDMDLRGAPAAGVRTFFHAFRNNRSITTSQLWISYSDDWKKEKCLQHLAECLMKNSALLVMVLKSPNASSATTTTTEPQFTNEDALAFVRMLEANCFGPISLELDDYQGKYLPLVRLHTYLNVEGREPLIVPAPDTISPEMWMRLLLVAATTEKPVSSHYRVDAIFQILQRNPALIGATL
jgi:hypothetical protein